MKKVTFVFKDSIEISDILDELSEKSGLSKSAIIRIALRKYLESVGKL